jgi:hypothetical protein
MSDAFMQDETRAVWKLCSKAPARRREPTNQRHQVDQPSSGGLGPARPPKLAEHRRHAHQDVIPHDVVVRQCDRSVQSGQDQPVFAASAW